jgi:hypothetical protein
MINIKNDVLVQHKPGQLRIAWLFVNLFTILTFILISPGLLFAYAFIKLLELHRKLRYRYKTSLSCLLAGHDYSVLNYHCLRCNHDERDKSCSQ